MAQETTRDAVPVPKGVTDTIAEAEPHRWLDVLHELHLLSDDPAALSRRLAAFDAERRRCAERALAELPTDLAARVRAAWSGAETGDDRRRIEAIQAESAALTEIYERLRSPYDSMLGETAAQGRAAVHNSVLYTGRERAEELKDAIRLLRAVLDHPVGARNWAVWFELGWALRASGAPSGEVEEAFYQAQRLGGPSGDAYQRLALRHLALIQLGQERDDEARSAQERALALVSDDPESLCEEARLTARGGDPAADQAVQRALDLWDGAAAAILAEPDLKAFHIQVARTLASRTENARHAAEASRRRLADIYALSNEIQEQLGVSAGLPPFPDPETRSDEIGLQKAIYLASSSREQALDALQCERAALEKESSKVQQDAERLRRALQQAIREKAYWEGSARNLEEEARLAGLPLHTYTFNNPFKRRKNQRAEQIRQHYQHCKESLAQSEAFLNAQQPKLESEIARLEARLAVVAGLRTQVEALADG